MGLFNFFKKQPDSSPAQEDVTKAKEHFDKGEFQESLRTLAWGFKKDVNYKPLYKLAADSLGRLNANDEKKLFEAISRNMQDSNAFNNLGDFYFDVGHYDLAQIFYEKTLELDSSHTPAIHDLAICYARRFQISKAIDVLTNSASSDFWDLYFLNKCKILDKQIDGVQESISDLQAFLDEQPPDEDTAILKMKVEEIQETLQRFKTIPDIRTHIRDWQYIQYGGVVLDYFEDGEDDNYVAGGRYVASWGSTASIKTLANKMKQFADKLLLSFQGVVSFTDRDSEIIGRLLAKEFGVGFSFYDPVLPNRDCLIVSADSSYFQEHKELNTIRHGQVLLSINHSWLDSAAMSPDIIGFMAQMYSFPWSGNGMRVVDMESRSIERIPPDNRSAEEIADDIFNQVLEPEDISTHLSFYAEHKEYLKGIGSKTNNNRYNFMIESPVPGSYFS